MNKQKVSKVIKYIGWKALGAFVFVAVAGTSIWALAAFTEPTTGPSASVQDFAKNIMGANNADNAFDSGSVVANSDGSIVERLEALEARGGATALSAQSGSAMNDAPAATYCRNLSASAVFAIDGSDTSTTYSDWRLGSMTELMNFVGMTSSGVYIYTATRGDAYYGTGGWIKLRMSDGYWVYSQDNADAYVRCVR